MGRGRKKNARANGGVREGEKWKCWKVDLLADRQAEVTVLRAAMVLCQRTIDPAVQDR